MYEYISNIVVFSSTDFTLNVGCDRKIPTLREVFTAFPTIPINIDVKVYNDELFQKVLLITLESHMIQYYLKILFYDLGYFVMGWLSIVEMKHTGIDFIRYYVG